MWHIGTPSSPNDQQRFFYFETMVISQLSIQSPIISHRNIISYPTMSRKSHDHPPNKSHVSTIPPHLHHQWPHNFTTPGAPLLAEANPGLKMEFIATGVVQPGDPAPEFTLPASSGGEARPGCLAVGMGDGKWRGTNVELMGKSWGIMAVFLIFGCLSCWSKISKRWRRSKIGAVEPTW